MTTEVEEPTGAPAAEPAQSPTAKEMAAAEEINASRVQRLSELANRPQEPEPPPLIGLAAQGMDALHDALRQHGNRPAPEYVPPPRTQRQMTVLEEELEAGRKAQQRAQDQNAVANEARARASAEERAKEGFTNPVHRPGDMVPNPMGGVGQFLRE